MTIQKDFESYKIERDLTLMIINYYKLFDCIKNESDKLMLVTKMIKIIIDEKLDEYKIDSEKYNYWQQINNEFNKKQYQ